MPFNLFAEIGLDGSKFAAGLTQLEKGVDHFKEKLNHTGEHHLADSFGAVFGFAAIEQATHKTIEYGAHIFDLGKRLDVSREDLQRWDYAVGQNGATLDEVSGFFEKLGVNRRKALEGNQEMINSFGELGVTIEDLKQKNLQGIAEKIAEAVKTGDAQKLIGALRDVGGRGAGALVAAFKAGLPELFEEADKLGIVIKDDVVVQLKEAEDAVKQLAAEFRGTLAPAITWTAERLGEMLDLLKIVVGGEAVKAGTIAGGGTLAEANEAARKHAEEVIDERIARERHAQHKAHEHIPGDGGGDDEEVARKQAVREAEKQLKLRERLEEITRKNNLNELTASERILELTKQRAEILNKMGPLSIEELTKAEEMRGDLISLTKGKNLAPENDPLGKIGAFLGNASKAGDPLMEISIAQLEVQRQIQVNTDPTQRPTSQF